jgi:hypothetical protein
MIIVTLVSEPDFDVVPLLLPLLLLPEEPELLQAPTTRASATAPTPPTRALRLVTFVPIWTSIRIFYLH